MGIEHGIRLGSGAARGGGKEIPALFEWVYLGPEFCENLLETGVCAEMVHFQKLGKKVCLLTPLLTERGIASLTAIFREVSRLLLAGRLDAERLEITVNDFGALELAAAEKLPVKLSAGRQFTYNVFEQNKGSLSVLSRRALDFFLGLGVRRYEVSAAGTMPRTNFRERDCGFKPEGFNFTLHYPYLNLTTTRTCLVGLRDIQPRDSVRGIDCGRECRACAFKVDHPWVKEKLLIRGNTVFMEFPGKFYSSEKELERLRVDRLVYCPLP
ncbi:MAG: hypothetical protein NTY45_08860 [Elusimicrobia bacterium]|nr:hypothetical protein [Elusimicrobiota bacterium]